MGGKGSHACIWGLLFDVEKDLAPAAIGMVAIYIVGFIFYGILFSAAWQRVMAIDKGVRRADAIKSRYSMLTCSIGHLVMGFLQSAAIIAVLKLLAMTKSAAAGDSLCMYMQAAGVVFVAQMTALHHSMWEQRPFGLIFLTALGDKLSLFAAAAAIFYYTH